MSGGRLTVLVMVAAVLAGLVLLVALRQQTARQRAQRQQQLQLQQQQR